MENAAIHLSTPCPEKQRTLTFDPHPVKIKAWLDNLPLASTGETAHSIYCALTSMNRAAIPVQHRCQILEFFRPPLRHVMNALRKHYIDASFPLSETGIKVALLARELQIEMAHGYKIALNNLVGHPSAVYTTAKALPLLHHAMRYLIDALLTSYQAYMPPPATIWHDLHQMYLYAEKKTLHESAIHDKQSPPVPHHSVSELYKQALLLALASPYHLPQRDIGTVATALDKWANHSKLSFVIDLETPPESFLIDLEKDEPTSAPVTTRRNHRVTSYRLLETTGLINHLSALSTGNNVQPGTMPSPDLLKKLITAWGAPAKRHFSRMHKNTRVNVVLGLNTLYEACGGVLSASGGQEKARFTSRPVMGIHGPEESWDNDKKDGKEHDEQDVWNVVNQTAYFKKQQAEKNHTQATTPYTTFACEVINESAGGACLAWEGNKKEGKFKIGQLIGISTPSQEDAREWSVAVIRWMKHVKNSRMEFGIQMITPIAESVKLCHSDDATQGGDYETGMLLPEIRIIDQASTLILSSNRFKTGDKLTLILRGRGGSTSHDEIREVILGEIVQDTGLFVQIRFMPLETVTVHQTVATAEQPQGNSFEMLWDSI